MTNVLCDHWVRRDEAVNAAFSRIPYFPLVIRRGLGAMLEDVDGNQFIDLLSSASSQCLGQANPEIIEAVKLQMEDYIQASNVYHYNPKTTELAEVLTRITPGTFRKRVAFGLTGSDSIDGVIKLAKNFTGRSRIITFNGAYHGSTYGALSLSHVSVNMRRGLGATLPDIYAFPYPNPYRDDEQAAEKSLCAIRAAFEHSLPPEEVAAIILEPLQGDGGLILPPKAFMEGIAQLCREYGMLLISDEVQQGFLRTGTWFGIDQFGLEPDLIVVGKAMAAGLPMSAIIGRAEIFEALGPPAHGFTMGGNATCAAAALKNLEILSRPGFREDMLARSGHLRARLEALAQKHPCIGDVRGAGFSLGIEIVCDRETKAPDDNAAKKICYQGWRKGIVMVCVAGNVLRIQPPLIITLEQIDRAVDIIEACVTDFEGGAIDDSVLDTIKGWQ